MDSASAAEDNMMMNQSPQMMDDTSGGEDVVGSLIELNQLAYEPPRELSVVSNRSLRRFESLRSENLGGSTIFIDIAPGSSFINPAASYLSFRLANVGSAQFRSGTGSLGLNVLRSVVCRSRSGVELSRLERAGIYQRSIVSMCTTNNYQSTVGSTIQAGNSINNGNYVDILVPLHFVSPMFSSRHLIPSMMGPIRLELQLETGPQAFFTQDASAPAYRITETSVYADCFTLSDSILRRLSVVAAQTGLNYVWEEAALTVTNVRGNSVTSNHLKSASRALRCIIHTALQSDLDDNSKDGYLTITEASTADKDLIEYQAFLGSLPLQSEPIRGAPRAFHMMNTSVNGHDPKHHASNLSITDYRSRGYYYLAYTLERSANLAMNGSATSSSRPLITRIKYGENGDDKVAMAWLVHVRLAAIYSDSNILVKD